MKGAVAAAGGVAISQLPIPSWAAVGGPVFGCWPDGPDYSTMLQLESRLGSKFGAFRERGAKDLNRPLYTDDMVKAVQGGRQASLEINCRVNKQQYISYDRVISGEFDAQIRANARQARALSIANGKHLIELQSEVSTPGHVSGPPEKYKAFCARIDRLFREEGARDRVLFVLSNPRPTWLRDESRAHISPVHDVFAADGYGTTLNDNGFASIATAVRATAASYGKKWGVFETGVQENIAGGKPNWLNGLGTFVEQYAGSCVGVFYNHSSDSGGPGFGNWWLDSSSASLTAARQLMSRSFWG
jgi:hypothetical protein